MDAGRVDYKGATCAPRTCRLGKGVTDVDTGHVRYEEVAWTSNIAPRTYLLGDAVITNIYSSGGSWVGILTGLFEPLDKEVYFKDERVRCTIRWLDAFAGRAKKNDETSLLRRTKIEPVPGELYMYDISDPFFKPVAHIGGRAFLATIPEALEEPAACPRNFEKAMLSASFATFTDWQDRRCSSVRFSATSSNVRRTYCRPDWSGCGQAKVWRMRQQAGCSRSA